MIFYSQPTHVIPIATYSKFCVYMDWLYAMLMTIFSQNNASLIKRTLKKKNIAKECLSENVTVLSCFVMLVGTWVCFPH